MIDVIYRFGPYVLLGLVMFFGLGGFVVAIFEPKPQWDIVSRYEQNRLEHRKQVIFIFCMAAAAICGLALLGCLMIWWESL